MKKTITRDDLLDITEMTQNLENCIFNIVKDNEFALAMSALIGATINTILSQCENLDQIVFCRNVFMEIFDSAINDIKVQEK